MTPIMHEMRQTYAERRNGYRRGVRRGAAAPHAHHLSVLGYAGTPMSIHQTVTFQEALDIVESLPEDQRETLVAVVRHRLIEHTRDMLSKRIEEARQELSRGEVRRGTVDDLMKELSNENV